MMMQQSREQEYLALMGFTRRFACLIDSGVTLLDCMTALAQEPIQPYDRAAQAIRQAALEGSTLTDALKAQPELFPPTYIFLIYAGEIGGILEETLFFAAELLELDWNFSQLIGWDHDHLALFLAGDTLPDDLAALDEEQCALLFLLFCRSFGLLLSAGVPIVQSMEVVGGLLPTVQREQWLAIRQGVQDGTLHSVVAEFLPPTVRQLFATGEQTGTLDYMLPKAAEIYRHELETRRWMRVRQALRK